MLIERSAYRAFCLQGVLFLGVLLIRHSACRAFYSWILVLGVLVPGVLVPGVLVPGVTGTRSPGSPRQSRQLSAVTRPLTASPRGLSRVVVACFKGVSWEGLCGR